MMIRMTEGASNPWTLDRVDVGAVCSWIGEVTGSSLAASPPSVLRAKEWGITLRFDTHDGAVVFKASFPVLFPSSPQISRSLSVIAPEHAPQLISSCERDEQQWELFHLIDGTVVQSLGPEVFPDVASTLAHVQALASEADLSSLPSLPVTAVPSRVVGDIADQPVELRQRLERAQPKLEAWAIELADWPTSIDHPDMNMSNAILRPGGGIVIVDWEEATVGCPFLSFDRLLLDTRTADASAATTDHYLDALPWRSRPEREQALRRALALAPLKLVIEARRWARLMGRATPHTAYTSQLLRRSLDRADSIRGQRG